MQENIKNGAIITARFDHDSSDSIGFALDFVSEEVKKKRAYVSICFTDGITHKPMKISQANEYSQYANADGEICIAVPVKKENFSGKQLKIDVPYEMFIAISTNDRVNARIALITRDDEQTVDAVEFELMANLGKKFTIYSLDKHVKYLKTIGTEQEKLDCAIKLTQSERPADDVFAAVVDLLVDLAENCNNCVAQYILYTIYRDDTYGSFDAVMAVDWLKRSADNGYEDAVKEIEDSKNIEALQKASDRNTLELYKKAAEDGHADAQYIMYEYCNKQGDNFDEKKAAMWLKKSAENGYDRAVVLLGQYLGRSFVSTATVNEYLGIMNKATEKNCGEAYLELFNIYFTGKCLGEDVRVDKKFAVDCLLRAADHKCYNACYKIWKLYVSGNDLLMDEPTAISWLKVAADGMIPAAINDLGELYVVGKGVDKNDAEGIELIKKAAELKNSDAQLKIFRMYMDGRYKDVLIEKDENAAISSLISYAKGGNLEAQLMLWDFYKNGNPIMFTRREALLWLEKAASQQYLPAMYELANVCLADEYADINVKKARDLLESAAKYGYSQAQYALYKLYYFGEYLALKGDVNKERAYKWLIMSAENYDMAQHEMWRLYRDTNEMKLDANEALGYLHAAVKAENPAAVYDVAALYIKGDMLAKDVAKGVAYIEKSKRLKYPKAIYELSKIYCEGMCEGEPVEKDEKEGTRLLLLAAEYGYAAACSEVWDLYQKKNPMGIEESWAKKLLSIATQAGSNSAPKAQKDNKDKKNVQK